MGVAAALDVDFATGVVNPDKRGGASFEISDPDALALWCLPVDGGDGGNTTFREGEAMRRVTLVSLLRFSLVVHNSMVTQQLVIEEKTPKAELRTTSRSKKVLKTNYVSREFRTPPTVVRYFSTTS